MSKNPAAIRLGDRVRKLARRKARRLARKVRRSIRWPHVVVLASIPTYWLAHVLTDPAVLAMLAGVGAGLIIVFSVAILVGRNR